MPRASGRPPTAATDSPAVEPLPLRHPPRRGRPWRPTARPSETSFAAAATSPVVVGLVTTECRGHPAGNVTNQPERHPSPPSGSSTIEQGVVQCRLEGVAQSGRVSASSITVYLCGIKFFYETTLKRTWQIFEIVKPAPDRNCRWFDRWGDSAHPERDHASGLPDGPDAHL